MLSPILSESQAALWRSIIGNARTAVVTAHSAPDGDAVGSSLALAGYLRSRGIDTTVVMPDASPDFLRWLPGQADIVCYDEHPDEAEAAVAKCDVLFCLDYNDFSRIGALAKAAEDCAAQKIMVDHHPEPSINAALAVSRPDLSSTSEVVFRLLWQDGYFPGMARDEAVCIYCGMMTDTGGFTYNSSSPEIFFIICQLLTKGFDKDEVYRNVFNNYTVSRVRLMGYILHTKLHFYKGLHACRYTLTAQEMRRFNFRRGDAEGLVNIPLCVKGMRLSVALRDDTERGCVRVSLRSVGDFPCNRLAAEYFGGGGHLNASGGEFRGTMDEAVRALDKAIEAYAPLLR